MHLTRPAAHERAGRADLGIGVALVAAAGLAAATAGASPTGHAGADLFWRALAGIAVAAAGASAGPSARMVPALAAAAVGAGMEAWGVAAAACMVLVASAWLPHLGRWAVASGTAVAGAGGALLFRLPDLPPARATTTLGVLAGLVVLVVGWRGAPRSVRRALRWATGLAIGVLAALSLPFLVAGAYARADANRGAGEAFAWRFQTTEGNEDAAVGHLERAGLAFAEADEALDGWWMAPARLVPLVAQHADAAEVGVRSGRRLVESAGAILDVARPEELKVEGGALDLDLVQQIRVPLGAGATTLTTVERQLDALERDWLLWDIQGDVREVTRQVRDARRDAAFADRVLDVLPGLLGGDGAKRYFVVFATPAEARELGGILGNWGILTADGGRLDLERTGRAGELNRANDERGVELSDPGSYPARYVRTQPEEFWQNVTSAPDLPTVARAVADLYGQATGETIDGVMVVDPVALSALLELTGPVEVEGLGRPLDAGSAVDLLLRDQYVEFPELGDRVDFLSDAAEATFDRLTDGTLPGPARIAEVLGPVVTGRHLLFWPLDPQARPVLTEVGLDGALPSTEDQDVLAVAHANLEANKLDAYLREDLGYDVEVDEGTGRLTADLTVTYTNEAPPGLPDYVGGNDEGLPSGTNRVLLSVWTPHRASGATVDGEPVGLERQIELGRNRYLRNLVVPPGGSVTFRVRLDGVVAGPGYRLTVVRQPLGEPSELTVEVRDPQGETVRKGTKVTVVGG